MSRPAVGLALAPDPEWMRRCEPLLGLVGYVSLTPETLWRGNALTTNGYWAGFADLQQATGLPAVAHSVGVSLGGADPERRRRWLAAVARDHRQFRFEWWTDHLWITEPAGQDLVLPLPLPAHLAADRVRASLDQMAEIVPIVGAENSAQLFTPIPPLEEAALLRRALGPHRLLLDLHNLYVDSANAGFDPYAWLDRAPLDQVIEIHLAGGQPAPDAWGLRPLRLDSHDAQIPPPVWSLLRAVLPRCPALRGVTLERIEGTVMDVADVEGIAADLERVGEEVERWGGRHNTEPQRSTEGTEMSGGAGDLEGWEREVAALLRDPDPQRRLAERREEASGPLRGWLAAVDPDGLQAAALLAVRLRVDRLRYGDPEVARQLEQDPAALVPLFRRYHAEIAPACSSPAEEGRRWRRWRAGEIWQGG